MKYILCFFFTITIGVNSLADVSVVLLPLSVKDLYATPDLESTIKPEDVFSIRKIWAVGDGSKKEAENMLLVNAEHAAFADFGEYKAYALPIEVTPITEAKKIIINGYLVDPKKKGKKYVYFPLASAYDENRKLLSTLEPLEGSKSRGNTIANLFELPIKTNYLLIHTRPEFVTFTGELSERSNNDIKMGVAGLLGGAVGGIFMGALSNFDVQRGKVGIAPVGVIEVVPYNP